jgi:hypothetical protein
VLRGACVGDESVEAGLFGDDLVEGCCDGGLGSDVCVDVGEPFGVFFGERGERVAWG